MRGFLLDTNILSELRRPRPEPAVLSFVSAQPEARLFISDVTFAEIRFGINQVADPERRATIDVWLTHTLRPLFSGRTLAITEQVILRGRLLTEAGRRRGHTFGHLDLFIAASAMEEDLVVVSRNATHFVAANVAHLDPWFGRYTSRVGNDHLVDRLSISDLLEQLQQLT